MKANIQRIELLRTTPWETIPWWRWFEIAGTIGLVFLTAALLLRLPVPPIVTAIVVHVACDFTLQSEEMSHRKRERGRHLLVHASIAGAFPLLLATMSNDTSPITVLICGIVGVTIHYIIDYMDKLGLTNPWGVVIDQGLHLTTIVGLLYLVR